MRIFFAPLLFLLTFHSTLAQNPCNRTLTGIVLDIETKEPLPFATIRISGTELGAVANEHGEFRIDNICKGEIHLIVDFLGYKQAIHHHDFYHKSPVIYLAPDAISLESVVIEEDRSSVNIQSLTVESKQVDLSDKLGSSAGEILESLSGVSSLRTGSNIAKPMVHGLHSNRVLLINNGVRHSYQGWGAEHAPEIDPSQIDRLSLVKGAATVRYGPEALGGVILFSPQQPQFDQSLSGEIGTGFETNGRAYTGNVSLNQGFHRLAWNGGIYYTRQGDLRSPNYFLTNTGKEETGYNLGLKLHRSIYDLDFYVSSFSQTLGILRGSVVGSLEDLAQAIGQEPPEGTADFSYDIGNPSQETSHNLYKLKGSVYLGEHIIEAQYAFQRNLRKEFDVRRGSNNLRPSIDLELITHSLDLDWKYPDQGHLKGSAGLQYFYQDNNNRPGTNTIPFVPDYNVTNIGLFTVQTMKKDNSTFEAGARFDYQYLNARGRDQNNNIYRNSLSYNNLTFTLGYNLQINEHTTFRTNLGSAWRPPKVGELYSFGKHQFALQYGIWRYELFPVNDSISTTGVLNNDQKKVESEKGLKWIAAIEIEKQKLQFEIVPYVNYIRDYFFQRPYGIANTIRGPFPYFIFDQTNALFTGADLSLRFRHTELLTSEFKGAYVYARDVKNDQFFAEIPALNLNYSIEKKIKEFAIQLSGEYAATQWNAPGVIPIALFLNDQAEIDRSGTFDFIPATEGYFLFHSKVSYQKNQLTATIQIQNIMNSEYRYYTDRIRYFADNVGRNLSITAAYRLSK